MSEPEFAWVSVDGEHLDIVAFTDEDMFECPEANAFYAIAKRLDGELEAVEIIARPSVH